VQGIDSPYVTFIVVEVWPGCRHPGRLLRRGRYVVQFSESLNTIYGALSPCTSGDVYLDIAQKYGFYYHNLVFMLNLILSITHTCGRVH